MGGRRLRTDREWRVDHLYHSAGGMPPQGRGTHLFRQQRGQRRPDQCRLASTALFPSRARSSAPRLFIGAVLGLNDGQKQIHLVLSFFGVLSCFKRQKVGPPRNRTRPIGLLGGPAKQLDPLCLGIRVF